MQIKSERQSAKKCLVDWFLCIKCVCPVSMLLYLYILSEEMGNTYVLQIYCFFATMANYQILNLSNYQKSEVIKILK